MISNRSTLTTFYEFEKEDGTKIVLHSSMGNEALVQANNKQIGKDVVTNNVITFMSWKPYDGGIYFEHIVKMDPCGMIPGWLKKKGATRTTRNLQMIIDYLVNGTIPEPLF